MSSVLAATGLSRNSSSLLARTASSNVADRSPLSDRFNRLAGMVGLDDCVGSSSGI